MGKCKFGFGDWWFLRISGCIEKNSRGFNAINPPNPLSKGELHP